jgi:PAS domain S-box-containing protein
MMKDENHFPLSFFSFCFWMVHVPRGPTKETVVTRPLHVLIVDDSEDDALLLVHELRRGNFAPTIERVDTAAALSAALDQHSWDVVLADYALPTFSAPLALALLQDRGIDLPFIIVSGTIEEEAAVAALKAGAHDFIVKHRLARLIPAIERELRKASERRTRLQAERALHESESRFQRLADNAPDIIYRYRLVPAPGFEYVSPAVTAITGYTPAEHYADPNLWNRIVQLDDRQRLETILQSPTKRDAPLIMRWVRKDGTIIWTDHRLVPIHDATGTVVAVEGIARDITAHKQAEAQIQRQMEHLISLRMIDRMISAGLDLRVMLSVLLDQVTTQLQVDAAAVLLLDAPTQLLGYAAGRGFYTEAMARSQLELGEGYAGRAALERRLVNIPNLAATDDFVRAPLLTDEGFHTY